MDKILKYSIGITFLVLAIIAIISPEAFMLDDCFFYFQVADNIVKGNGSTFNNIVPTNGYHPLWMLFCIISSLLSFGDKILALKIGLFFQLLLSVGIIFYYVKLAKILKIKNYIFSLPFVLLLFMSFGLLGSEGFINGFLFLFTIYYFLKIFNEDKLSLWFVFGIILGFLFLSRLDNILGIIILGLYILIEKHRQIGHKSLLIILYMLSGYLIIALPYLLINYINFGHIVPISGAIKSRFPLIVADLGNIGNTGIIMTCLSALTIFWALIIEKQIFKRSIIILISAMSIAIPMYVYLFTDGHSGWHWYYVWNYIVFGLFIGLLIDKLLDKYDNRFLKSSLYLSAIIVCLYSILLLKAQSIEPANPTYNPLKFTYNNPERWEIQLGKLLGHNFPSCIRMAVVDYPGMLAYYSNLSIFPTDGLINDFESQDIIARKGMKYYFKSQNINYIFAPNYEKSRYKLGYWNRVVGHDSIEYRFLSILHRIDVDTILLTKSERVLKIKDSILSAQVPDWVIWKIR